MVVKASLPYISKRIKETSEGFKKAIENGNG